MIDADVVWKAMPRMGEPARTTQDIAQRLGVPAAKVIQQCLQLHRMGRAQRTTKGGSAAVWWRRQ